MTRTIADALCVYLGAFLATRYDASPVGLALGWLLGCALAWGILASTTAILARRRDRKARRAAVNAWLRFLHEPPKT